MTDAHKLDGVVGAIGVEILIETKGVLFDNFLVTDDVDEAEESRLTILRLYENYWGRQGLQTY